VCLFCCCSTVHFDKYQSFLWPTNAWSIWTETCRSVYTNVLIVSFNIFMLIKCAFVGHKKLWEVYLYQLQYRIVLKCCFMHHIHNMTLSFILSSVIIFVSFRCTLKLHICRDHQSVTSYVEIQSGIRVCAFTVAILRKNCLCEKCNKLYTSDILQCNFFSFNISSCKLFVSCS
jgi:hypothetical protein